MQMKQAPLQKMVFSLLSHQEDETLLFIMDLVKPF